MSAEIIDLPVARVERSRGNGAREALIEIAMGLDNTDEQAAAAWSDWLFAELWMCGFKVVPLE